MKRIRTLAAAAFFACALPAVAQAPAEGMGAQTNGNGAAAANGMAMASSCQGMMDKAMPKASAMSDGYKKTKAMRYMDMAKTEQAKDDEVGCKRHMHMAMQAMM